MATSDSAGKDGEGDAEKKKEGNGLMDKLMNNLMSKKGKK